MSSVLVSAIDNSISNNGTSVEERRPRITRGGMALARLLLDQRGVVFTRGAIGRAFKHLSAVSTYDLRADLEKEWDASNCALHARVECGEDGAAGCRGQLPGTHGVFRGLYEVGHTACLAEPGTRAKDRYFCEVVEGGRSFKGKFLNKFVNGCPLPASSFGAGYCYIHLFVENVRMRLARVLGPAPVMTRVAWYFLFLGLPSVHGYKLQEVGDGLFHVAIEGSKEVPHAVICAELLAASAGGARLGAALEDVDALRAAIARVIDGPSITVGHTVEAARTEASSAASARVSTGGDIRMVVSWEEALGDSRVAMAESSVGSKAAEWLYAKLGVHFDADVGADIALVLTPNSHLPAGFLDFKDRKETFALVGDAFIRYYYSLCVLGARRNGATFTDLMLKATNEALAELFVSCGLADAVGYPEALRGKRNSATVYEALVGVLAAKASAYQARDFLCATMDLPEFEYDVSGCGFLRDEVAGTAAANTNITPADIAVIRALKARGVL